MADIALLRSMKPIYDIPITTPRESAVILHASAHRITGDDGCFRPTPQYHADFVASFFNFTARPQKIGLLP
jgi:hypothetical protein